MESPKIPVYQEEHEKPKSLDGYTNIDYGSLVRRAMKRGIDRHMAEEMVKLAIDAYVENDVQSFTPQRILEHEIDRSIEMRGVQKISRDLCRVLSDMFRHEIDGIRRESRPARVKKNPNEYLFHDGAEQRILVEELLAKMSSERRLIAEYVLEGLDHAEMVHALEMHFSAKVNPERILTIITEIEEEIGMAILGGDQASLDT